MNLVTTATPFTTGLDEVTGNGEQWTVAFSGTWRDCDRPQLILTDTLSGQQTILGFGATNSFTPSFLLTLKNKVYAACDTYLAFSAIATPTEFQDRLLNGAVDAGPPGNGYILPGNNYGTPESIVAMANYQGKLAVINRRSVQIWSMAADPASNELIQTLENIGTFAPLSAQAVGTLDVILLADTGIRSLRVRDASNQAVTVDIGTPVDRDVQSALASLSEAERATCCAVVEPSSNRYWVYIPGHSGAEGKIFVLSYFPTANISAWSTYRPTYLSGGVNTPFIPQKFVVKDGRVYARTADGVIAYGGSDGNTYENCGVTAETPWLDAKSPATRKTASGLDMACQGKWAVSLGMDPVSGTLKSNIYVKDDANNSSSFMGGQIPVRMQGTHFKLKMEETSTGYARFSMVAFHYQQNEAS